MYCLNCNGLYVPNFIESNHYSKQDNSYYKLCHQECTFCHLIMIGIYEFNLGEYQTDSKKRMEKIKFLKH